MQSFDRLRMMGKRLRMKVLVDEDDSKIKMRLPCLSALSGDGPFSVIYTLAFRDTKIRYRDSSKIPG